MLIENKRKCFTRAAKGVIMDTSKQGGDCVATWNKELHRLSREDVDRISLEYLMGWQDLIKNGYSFRIKGFNHMREKFGLEPLTKEMSLDYRVEYVKTHFTENEIREQITQYMRDARVGRTRWSGIELFDCRFGREYAVAFKRLLGASEYRKLAEDLRNRKSIETQTALHGGVGLAGHEARQKASATNLIRYGGANVMADPAVRQRLAATNEAIYGGPSPFSDSQVRHRCVAKNRQQLHNAMLEYKRHNQVSDFVCESFGEFDAFKLLVDRFGANDVFSQYGVHPYDARYPYNCDIYVKSLDLFIELNFYFVHGRHWFDEHNHDDLLRAKHLQESGSAKSRKAIQVWTIDDVAKRKKAADSGIKYLVFWYKNQNQKGLAEFNDWFFRYNCDYEAFVRDHPENTY